MRGVGGVPDIPYGRATGGGTVLPGVTGVTAAILPAAIGVNPLNILKE